ncbi:hypothetical protein KKG48_00695, partial [Patescibacteria group bacterium]|nr:hypothetical protein [Patescibacteria group bacterium]
MTPFFSFLKNKVFQKTKKWCHARKDGFSGGKSVDKIPSAFCLREKIKSQVSHSHSASLRRENDT